MKTSSVAACLLVALGSLEGCVAAAVAPEGDSGAPGRGAPEAGSDAPPLDDSPVADGGPMHTVEASMPDAAHSREGGGRGDAAGSGDAAEDADASPDAAHDATTTDSGAPMDSGPGVDSYVPVDAGFDSGPPPPIDSGPVCGPYETACSGTCVDTQTDPDHCGSCTTVCPDVTDGLPTCNAGSCGFVCVAAYHACGYGCDSDLSVDSCGLTSCTPCVPPANSTATCDGFSCGFSCDSGYHLCSGACDDNTSVESCGSSCTACPVPVNGTATCDGVSCGFTCNAGTVSCGGGTACCSINILAGGDRHNCAIVGTDIECFGLGSSGQLGNGSTVDALTESLVLGLGGTPVAVVAGYDHTCALTTAGAVQCWGDNECSDLGNTTLTTGVFSDVPVDVTGLSSGVVAIAAGDQHTCALLSTGDVECWGANNVGQLGFGSLTPAYSASAMSVLGLSGVVAISAGSGHSCAVTSAGRVWCWGDNSSGELGDGSTVSTTSPVKAKGLSGVVAVAAGDQFTCALTGAGAVWCWGDGSTGEIGNGSFSDSKVPVAIPSASFGGSSVVAISAPAQGVHVCALTAAGIVWCWGGDGNGALGDGANTNSASPVVALGLSGVTAIGTGDEHSCALEGSTFYCWGNDVDGQLGDGVFASDSNTPVEAYY